MNHKIPVIPFSESFHPHLPDGLFVATWPAVPIKKHIRNRFR